jgi:hypothetical protein
MVHPRYINVMAIPIIIPNNPTPLRNIVGSFSKKKIEHPKKHKAKKNDPPK